jgi:hypothetical protein
MSDKPPDGKDGFTEWIKEKWAPISLVVGVVISIYTLYNMWKGDQQVVTFIAAGIGLLTLVIVLGWASFKTKIVEIETIYQPNNQTTTKKLVKQPIYGLQIQRLARGVFILTLAIAVISGALFVNRFQAERLSQQGQAISQAHQTQTALWVNQLQATQDALATEQAVQAQQAQATQFTQATQQARQELEEKLIVVVAVFEGPEEVYGLRNEIIIESLNSAFLLDSEVQILAVNDMIIPDMGSSYARSMGEGLFADLVIWGWYRRTDDPNITIHIENLSSTQIDSIQESEILEPSAILAQLETFEIQRQLGSETTTLVSYLIGTLNYKSEEYEAAIDRFTTILESNDISTFISEEDLYFYLVVCWLSFAPN